MDEGIVKDTDVIVDIPDTIEEKYQGREVTSYLQAPDEITLDKMIQDIQEFATINQMGEVEVLQKQADPDGGWEAVVKAHNLNPFKWAKEKYESRGGGEKERKRKKKSEHRLKMIKRKMEAEEKEVEMNVRILKAKEMQRSQKPQLKKAIKGGRGKYKRTKTERPSIITVNINKEKKARRSKKHKVLRVLPKTKPQETWLYKHITG